MKGEIAAPALGALLLLALTFGAEAELCYLRSKTYKGHCFWSENCAGVCVSEHFTGGFCNGILWRHCICTKECDNGGNGHKTPPLPVTPPPPVSGGGNAPPLPVSPPLPITPPLPPSGCKPPTLKCEEKEPSVELTARARRVGGHA